MGELYHYGVKGMKWGVRKSPDRASRRERRATKKQTKIEKKRNKALSVTSSAKYTYKQRKYLSDDELRYRINRLNMEKQLKDLSRKNNPVVNNVSSSYNTLVKPGKEAAGKALSLYGAKVLVTSTVGPEAGAFIRPKK